jgi:signal peptidase I
MKKILGILKDIAICFIVAFLINRFVFMFAFVPTGSMKPTIMEKDRIIVDRISLLFNEIERGDIVVFEANATQGAKLLVKRVVGLPGETVEIKEGKVFINEEPFDEEYVYYPDDMSMEKIEIGEDNYLMLGDNRSNSFDARFWDKKTIEKKDIIGFARLFKKR